MSARPPAPAFCVTCAPPVNVSAPNSSRTGPAWRRLLRRCWNAPGLAWGALVAACVGSRLATTITYIEDPDSLRFALSVADTYDIAALQPHFPGYPVFWAAAEGFYLLTGAFSASFSVVGGLATAGIIWALLRLRGVALRSVDGAAIAGVVVFSPLVWLMGTRYMPDLLGTAAALAALALLIRAVAGRSEGGDETAALGGIVLTGLLAGLRLSYLPLVVAPALFVLWRSRRPLRLVGAGLISVAVWLVPMILSTGVWTLIDVAWGQTTGHFTDFGGTVQTESDLGRRVSGTVQGLWADGLGGWWPGRHGLTGITGAGVLGLSGLGAWRLFRDRQSPRRVWWIGGCVLAYGLWMFFFQNVVHKSRHVLPLLALLLPVLAAGAAALWRRRRGWARAAVLGAAGAYATVALVLAVQHQNPTALAQAKRFVAAQTERPEPTRVASVPLVNTYLQSQQVDARVLSVDDSSDVHRLRHADTGRTLVIGTYASLLGRSPTRTRTFYHNPHVNRMWPTVTVYVYEY